MLEPGGQTQSEPTHSALVNVSHDVQQLGAQRSPQAEPASGPSQIHRPEMHAHSPGRGDGPQQQSVGGVLLVPGGHCQLPATQIGARPASEQPT